MEDTEEDEIEEGSTETLDPFAFNRANFTRILWERFTDPSMAHDSTTLRYAAMLAEYNGWDKPDPLNGKVNLTIKIGECEDCKRAGRDTSWPPKQDQLAGT